MTSWTGMCIRRSREGVCKNNAMQFLFSYGSSYCTAPGEMAVLSSANSEILVWSDDGAGNSLKADSMCTTQTVVTEHSRWCQNWWEVCGKQFCRTGASQFRNFLVNSADVSLTAARNRFLGDRKTFPQQRWGTDGIISWLQTLAIDSYDRDIQTLVHRYDNCFNNGGDYVDK